MKLVDDQNGYDSSYIIINGNGKYPDLLILKRICKLYNGRDKIIIFPRTPMKRFSGLSALRNIRLFLDSGYRNLIFIADREHIKRDANAEIKSHLIGIRILGETPLQEAFLLKCRLGNRDFNLFCNISGLTNCIEEELLKLVELQLNIQINLPPIRRDGNWRSQLKAEIDKHANRKQIKRILNQAGRSKLERAFPNLCAIFNQIDENYEI
ncbi:hypothetical protein LCGC14_2647910 [marine sediment metagenome]|uniref:Uncharacterized protein n=1 Tax=marine sediment metagenome TaxID=412755 RepID=A0A0F8ZVQ3_9ZZZZ